MSNYRLSQQESRVKKIISHLLQNEIKDPRVGFVSVTGVNLTKDLSECKVYVSLLGDDHEIEETMEALKSAAGFVRKQVASKANLRRTPQIDFIYDNSLSYGSKIDKLLREVKKDE
jgi:ribosome-binding factor A